MPYLRKGKKIYTKSSGKWKLKQTAKTIDNAKAALRLLQGLEHGSVKPSQVGKSSKSKGHKKYKVLYKD